MFALFSWCNKLGSLRCRETLCTRSMTKLIVRSRVANEIGLPYDEFFLVSYFRSELTNSSLKIAQSELLSNNKVIIFLDFTPINTYKAIFVRTKRCS